MHKLWLLEFGNRTSKFQLERRLGLGDSLSSFLNVLTMEAIDIDIRVVVANVLFRAHVSFDRF